MKDYINVIGAGLAGSEAAYQIAKRGIKVKLYEMKPVKFSPAHSNSNFAEIVCSNSFKSNLLTNACGLLKEELRRLDSLLIKIADETAVPAGQALAVDREEFAKKVTESLKNNLNIEIINKEVVSKYDETIANKNQKANLAQGENKKLNNTIAQDQSSKMEKNSAQRNENIEETEPIFFEDLINEDAITIIATGPLTSDSLSIGIKKLTGENDLHFYDAAAPIIEKDSIDFNIAFYGDRYEQEKKKDETLEEWHNRISEYNKTNVASGSNINMKSNGIDKLISGSAEKKDTNSYINLPMNKEEYENFVQELINAEVVTLHDFEKGEIFEGCMPVEVMAKRGIDTLRFGPLKPVGFDDPRTGKRPYAVVQLRQDNTDGTLYNMVGFQTNLKYGEQKRVFSMIPGLNNAEFVKYGVMHRNTFINSPELLDNTYNLKKKTNIYFAGQITGVEGYVESISSGMVASLNAVKQFNYVNKKLLKSATLSKLENKENVNNKIKEYKFTKSDRETIEETTFSKETMIGALADYISTPKDNFQPMNANFGILPPLEGEKIKDKKKRYESLSKRALEKIKQLDENVNI